MRVYVREKYCRELQPFHGVNRADAHGIRLYHERLFLRAPFLGTVLAEADDLPRIRNGARPAWRFEAGYQSAQSTKVIKRRLSAPFARIPCFNFCFGQNHVEKVLGKDSSQLILSGEELAEFWSAERSHLRRSSSAILTNASKYRFRCQEYAVLDMVVEASGQFFAVLLRLLSTRFPILANTREPT